MSFTVSIKYLIDNGTPIALPNCNSTIVVPTGNTVTLIPIVQNGSGSYSYQWTPSIPQCPSGVITPTASGTYVLSVHDLSKNIFASCSVTVSIPLSVSVSGTSGGQLNSLIKCGNSFKLPNGQLVKITAEGMGGSGIYSYTWTGPVGFVAPLDTNVISLTASELIAGLYTVTVKDLVSSQTTACSFTIAGTFAALDINVTGTLNGIPDPTIMCGASIASSTTDVLVLTAIGLNGDGTPIVYRWERNGILLSTTQSVTVSASGVYTIIISNEDNPNLTASCSLNITVSSPLCATVQLTSPNSSPMLACNDHATVLSSEINTLSVVAVGGTAPYSYVWATPDGIISTDQTIVITSSGTYNVTITDSSLVSKTLNCSITIIVADTTPLVINFLLCTSCGSRHVPCGSNICVIATNVNTLTAQIIGGIPPYRILWTLPNGCSSQNQIVSVLQCGIYTATVSDSSSPANINTCSVFIDVKAPLIDSYFCINDVPVGCGATLVTENCRAEIKSKICLRNYKCSILNYTLSINGLPVSSGTAYLRNCKSTLDFGCHRLQSFPSILKLVLSAPCGGPAAVCNITIKNSGQVQFFCPPQVCCQQQACCEKKKKKRRHH